MFAAFSTSSTPISMPMAFRLAAKHRMPQANRNAESIRNGV